MNMFFRSSSQFKKINDLDNVIHVLEATAISLFSK